MPRPTMPIARKIMLERALEPLPRHARKSISIIDFSVLSDAPLKVCAAAFGTHGARGKPAHVDDTVRHILRGLDEMHAPDLRPDELRQATVRALADLHVKAGRPATARHRLGGLNRLYKWLEGVDAAATNPVAPIEQPAPPQPRSNVLSAETVKLLWDSAERLPAPRRDYLRLAILTPFRRAELAGLRVSDVVVAEGKVSELRLDGTKDQEWPQLHYAPCRHRPGHRSEVNGRSFLPQRPSHSAYPRQAVLGLEKTSRADRKGDRDRVVMARSATDLRIRNRRTRGRALRGRRQLIEPRSKRHAFWSSEVLSPRRGTQAEDRGDGGMGPHCLSRHSSWYLAAPDGPRQRLACAEEYRTRCLI